MSELHQAVVADFLRGELEIENEMLAGVAGCVALDAHGEDDFLERVPKNTAAIMLYHHLSVTKKSMDALPKLKIVARCGVGFDNVDRAYARQRGVAVTNVPDYGTEEVADSAVGMLLALTRGIHLMNSRLQRGQGEWIYRQAVPLHRLRGRTFGIIGLGRIGMAVAVRVKALGMRVIFYDPYVRDGMDKAIALERVESVEDLLRQSFVVSAHSLLSEETRHIVNAKTIALMPDGSYLINTSRGGVVDTSAIPDAIASGKLAGAAIDVLEQEPPSADNPIVKAWRDPDHACHHRLILNPHAAFYCEDGLEEMRRKASLECRRVLLGDEPRNRVN